METEKKAFDCIEFKARTQEQILKALCALSEDEQREYLRRWSEEGPLGDWWKRVKEQTALGASRSSS